MNMKTPRDTFDNWADRLAGQRSGRPLAENEVVQAPAGKPVQAAIDLVNTQRAHYLAEAGKRDTDLVFHFFPLTVAGGFPSNFEEKLGDAFLQVFRFEERVQAAHSELSFEFGVSEGAVWSVRALGFADNIAADDLIATLFDVLDKKLE